MKRRLLKLGVFLLLGAIVNVAVAWGCAAISERKPYPVGDTFRSWIVNKPIGYPDVFFSLEYRSGIGFIEAHAHGGEATLWVSKAGWPYPSIEGGIWRKFEQSGPHAGWVIDEVHVGAVQVDATQLDRGARMIPFIPIWSGFAINTIFYAAILWLMWIAPGKVRRLVRVRQHRCPACGFIIAPGTCANGRCSECGARLPQRVFR